MVNIKARKERHAKLKNANIHKNYSPPANSVVTAITESFQHLCKQDNNPLMGKFLRRIIGCALTFFIVVSLMSTYQITYGSFDEELIEDGWDILDITGNDTEHTIQDIMTEDGFLLKPAINSTKGDRTEFSDIFIYTVQSGDTLSSIAGNFNLKKETIMAENNIWNANSIKAGMQIRILPVDGLSHEVKKGDTLEKIAKEYKVKKEDIIKQNQLKKDTLEIDTTLIIPGAKKEAPVAKPNSSGKIYGNTAPSFVPNYNGGTSVGRLIWPTGGQVTQRYRSGHLAIDIANSGKGAIYAAASGMVIKAETGWNGGYGNVIIIDHGNGMQTLYGHNEKLYVKEGQYVEQGQTIAWMGRSGRVYGKTGIHLHFEVRIKGVKYNPMNFF